MTLFFLCAQIYALAYVLRVYGRFLLCYLYISLYLIKILSVLSVIPSKPYHYCFSPRTVSTVFTVHFIVRTVRDKNAYCPYCPHFGVLLSAFFKSCLLPINFKMGSARYPFLPSWNSSQDVVNASRFPNIHFCRIIP